MLWLQTQCTVEVASPPASALTRQGKHEVQVQIAKPGVSRCPDSSFNVAGSMDSPERKQVTVEKALGSQTDSIEACGPHRFEFGHVDRTRICFARYFRSVDRGVSS